MHPSQPKAYRPGSPVVQLRVPEDTLARIDGARGEETRSAWVLRLIGRELDGQVATQAPAAGPLVLPPGELSPNVLCMTPGCFQRDTRKYDLASSRYAQPAPQPSKARSTSASPPRPQPAPPAAAPPD